MISVYCAKNSDEIHDVVSPLLRNRKANGRTCCTGTLTGGHDIVVLYIEEKTRLAAAIENEENTGEALQIFADSVFSALEQLGLYPEGREIHIFTHFGGQNKTEVEDYNKKLAEIAERRNNEALKNVFFFAVSKHHHIPGVLFPNNVIAFPDGDDYRRMVEKLKNHQQDKTATLAPRLEHLQAIALLCQALAQVPANKRKNQDWWREKSLGKTKGESMNNAFSDAEMTIINKEDGILLEFCKGLVCPYGHFDPSKHNLDSIAKTISSYLRRA